MLYEEVINHLLNYYLAKGSPKKIRIGVMHLKHSCKISMDRFICVSIFKNYWKILELELDYHISLLLRLSIIKKHTIPLKNIYL